MPDLFAVHLELTRTFRFYIALTVFANLLYAVLLGGSIVASAVMPGPVGLALLIPPAMVSTGFAALSAFAVAEAIGLHRAIKKTGRELALPHVTRSLMLPVQTILTLVFHTLLSLVLYAYVFFSLVGVL